MANRTDPSAATAHGANPQNLIEKILRQRVYGCVYWKEQCFGLTAETMVDKAIELEAYGGAHGGLRKPTPFLCLVLKMLQIAPEREIVMEFIQNDEYKYVRALGAFYLRLVANARDIYTALEPLYNDCRKLRFRQSDSSYVIRHMDEFIQEILTSDFVCDVTLPFLLKRESMVSTGQLPVRISALDGELDELEAQYRAQQKQEAAQNPDAEPPEAVPEALEEEDAKVSLRKGAREEVKDSKKKYKDERGSRSPERGRGGRSRSRSRSRRRSTDRRRGRDRSRSRSRDRRRSRSRDRRRRSGSREPEKEKKKKKKKEKKEKKMTEEEIEIEEANRLRASLGIKPLRK